MSFEFTVFLMFTLYTFFSATFVEVMAIKIWGCFGEHPVYGTTKLHNIITFGSHDESLRVLVIIDLLMSLAVPTVPAVYALV